MEPLGRVRGLRHQRQTRKKHGHGGEPALGSAGGVFRLDWSEGLRQKLSNNYMCSLATFLDHLRSSSGKGKDTIGAPKRIIIHFLEQKTIE